MSWFDKRSLVRTISRLVKASAEKEKHALALDQACTRTPAEVAEALSALSQRTWRAILQVKGLPENTLGLVLRTATASAPDEVLGLLVTNGRLPPELRAKTQERIRAYEERLAASQAQQTAESSDTTSNSRSDDESGYGQYSTGCGGC